MVDITTNQFDRDQLERVLRNWKLTPATFASKISQGKWIASPHLSYISLRIATSLRKGNARIILSMPPRHGKSELVSYYTPAWILETIGAVRIILASYGADLAEGFSRKIKSIFDDPANDALLRAKPGDVWRSEEFTTTLGGYMYAVGLGGAITGRGADVLLIDDYIKEIKEALSPAYRDYVWNWYVTTALTRLEPNGSVIIIATRWHSDDLIGRLVAQEPGEWEYIELPALARKGDIIGRQEGDALFPQRYDKERLAKTKTTLGSIFFEALYQQRPVDSTMRVTDTTWLKYWNPNTRFPRQMTLCRIWDLAATEGAGDWCVGTLCGWDPVEEIFIILNVVRKQLGPGQVEAIVKSTATHDGFGVDIGIEQEPGSAGILLVKHFENTLLKDFSVEAIPVSKAKLVRAQPLLAAAEDGKVYLYPDSDWNSLFEAEFETFPSTNKAIHDDMVDTAAAGYTKLSGKQIATAAWGKELDKYKTRDNTRSGNSNSIKLRETQTMFASSRSGASWGNRSRSRTEG